MSTRRKKVKIYLSLRVIKSRQVWKKSLLIQLFQLLLMDRMCGGGSGFTYCMSILEDIVGEAAQGGRNITRNITVVWALKEPESFKPALANTVAIAQANKIKTVVKLFITSQSGKKINKNILPSSLVEFSTTRPDLGLIFNEVVDEQISNNLDGPSVGGLGIGVCGPVQMVDNMIEIVRRLDKDRFDRVGGVSLLSEKFGW
ncbi:hypothetical protein BY996DRAFT_3126399 [Phakopsora pachyrhizi]|nr:hypothetical protein BY996DRAFT_3126399 [Phakopsora pachyrhizi]